MTITSSAIASGRDATACRHPHLNGTDDRWEGANSALPAVWVQYQFAGGTRQKVTSYTLTAQNADAANRSPASWTLQGSNDGSTWTTLDTITGQANWTAEEKRTYTINSPGSYEYYKIVISARAGSGGNKVALREMELIGTPSLTNWYMLVRLSESNSDLYAQGFRYNLLKSAGEDLRFQTPAGLELKHEIQKWDATGESLVWVQIPALSADEKILMRWGNPLAALPAYANGDSWSSSLGVWHLDETSTTSFGDSSSQSDITNINNLSPSRHCWWSDGLGDGTTDHESKYLTCQHGGIYRLDVAKI